MKNLRRILSIVYLASTVQLGSVWAAGGEGTIRGKSDERELQPLFHPSRGNGPSEHARAVFNYWTPSRVANAVPRDFLIDKRTGKAYTKDFGVVQGSTGKLSRVYALKEYGKRPGRSLIGTETFGRNLITSDDFSFMDPADGSQIGDSYYFKVTLNSPVQRVDIHIEYPDEKTVASFRAYRNSDNTWGLGLSGFCDGDWRWWATAKMKGDQGSSEVVNFEVEPGTCGNGGGTCSDLSTCMFDTTYAEGICHYNHPSVKNAENNGGRILFTMNGFDYICSGTVVNDDVSDRSIVLTAGHCIYDDENKAFATNVVFTPHQDDGGTDTANRVCTDDPFGQWAMNYGVVHFDFAKDVFPANTAHDFGFYVVNNSEQHCDGYSSTEDTLDIAVSSSTSTPWSIAPDPDAVGNPARSFGYPGNKSPCFASCFDPKVESRSNYDSSDPDDLFLPNCEMGGGSSGGAWAASFDATNPAAQTIISVNSWGYTNANGMGGPHMNTQTTQDVFDTAKTTTTGENICVSATTSTCPTPSTSSPSCSYRKQRPCENHGCIWCGSSCAQSCG